MGTMAQPILIIIRTTDTPQQLGATEHRKHENKLVARRRDHRVPRPENLPSHLVTQLGHQDVVDLLQFRVVEGEIYSADVVLFVGHTYGLQLIDARLSHPVPEIIEDGPASYRIPQQPDSGFVGDLDRELGPAHSAPLAIPAEWNLQD